MDKAQLLMVALIVLIICLVVWFTTWNINTSKEEPVNTNPNSRTANIAKVVGLIAAVSAGYLYYSMDSYEASCIWGGDPDPDKSDWGLIDNNMRTPSASGM